ncbi:MAG: hypothetical protein ACRELY_10680, partial [Polyangiaceae bacterium]
SCARLLFYEPGESSEVDMNDTSAAAHAAQVEAIRRLSPEERLRIGIDLSQATRRIALDGIRRRRPDLTEEDARYELARMLYGADLAARAWKRV